MAIIIFLKTNAAPHNKRFAKPLENDIVAVTDYRKRAFAVLCLLFAFDYIIQLKNAKRKPEI